MNDPSKQRLIDHYVSGIANESEVEALAEHLANDSEGVASLVETARVEALLQNNSNSKVAIHPEKRKTSRVRWILAATAVVVMLAFIWTSSVPPRTQPSRDAVATSGLEPTGTTSRPSILPPPLKRSSDFTPAMMRRLENYILPPLDLRGRTVAQAFNEIEKAVQEIGFDESKGAMPLISMTESELDPQEANEIDLSLSPEAVEFEGFVNYGSPIRPAGPSSLYRENLPLLATLRYLVALDGKQLAFRQTSITAVPAPPSTSETRSARYQIPPDFLRPRMAPDFRWSIGFDETEPTLPDADLGTRLREWGIELKSDPSSWDYDSSSSSITLTATNRDHHVLKAVLALIEKFQITKQINFEAKGIELSQPRDLLARLDLDSPLRPVLAGNASRGMTPILTAPQHETFIEAYTESPGVTSVSYPKVVSTLGRIAEIRSITNGDEDHLLATGWRDEGEPADKPWSGMKLIVAGSLIGEKIQLRADWELRGEMVGKAEDESFIYDGQLERSGNQLIGDGETMVLAGQFEGQDTSSTIVMMVTVSLIDPGRRPIQ